MFQKFYSMNNLILVMRFWDENNAKRLLDENTAKDKGAFGWKYGKRQTTSLLEARSFTATPRLKKGNKRINWNFGEEISYKISTYLWQLPFSIQCFLHFCILWPFKCTLAKKNCGIICAGSRKSCLSYKAAVRFHQRVKLSLGSLPWLSLPPHFLSLFLKKQPQCANIHSYWE